MRGALLCILTAASLSGCSLFDSTTYAEGAVVDRETGAPIEGVNVSFHTGGGFGSYPAVATDCTDSAGRFELSSDVVDGGSSGLMLGVNDGSGYQIGCGYDDRYVSAFPAGGVSHGRSESRIRFTLGQNPYHMPDQP
jgi:hypothetical protein